MPRFEYNGGRNWLIYEIGDSLELMSTLEDSSLDLVLTDPPYGIEYHSGHYRDGNPHRRIVGDDELVAPVDEYLRLLKPTGCILMFFSYKRMFSHPRMKNILVWVKNNWGMGDLRGDFAPQHEFIAFIPGEDFVFPGGKRPTNVWFYDRVSPDKLEHPTEKPVDLCRDLIRITTPEDGVVLDPFLGSGTTLRACRVCGRNGIGFEIDSGYEDVIRRRLMIGQKDLADWL